MECTPSTDDALTEFTNDVISSLKILDNYVQLSKELEKRNKTRQDFIIEEQGLKNKHDEYTETTLDSGSVVKRDLVYGAIN